MTLRTAGTALAACALLAGCTSASPLPTYPSARQEAQAAAQEVLRQGSTASLGIALVSRDSVVWAESFGLADVPAGRAATDVTMFAIGSGSKMFGAVAVMQLVDRGLVDLDAPLVRYVPSFRMADPRHVDITVRQLLSHTAGLPGASYVNDQVTSPNPGSLERTLAALAAERLKAAPGDLATYCNDCFTLVEPLVQAVTGKSYVEWVQAEVLAPLGMSHTAFTVAPFADDAYAKFHSGGSTRPQVFVGLYASAGVYTTPSDLANFLRVFLNEGTVDRARILSPSSVEEMGVDQTKGTFDPAPELAGAFGLGWDTVTEDALHAVGARAWSKNGGLHFYGSQMIVAPDAGLGVVVLGTAAPGFDPHAIAQRVLLRALAEAGTIPAFPSPLPPVAAPVAPTPDGLAARISGPYAESRAQYVLRSEPDGTLALLVLTPAGFVPKAAGLLHRSDGWFTSAADPLTSYRVVEAGGSQYLVERTAKRNRYELVQFVLAQRVQGTRPPLSQAWSSRVGGTWLLVNMRPDWIPVLVGETPRLVVAAYPEFPGLVTAIVPLRGACLVDPSGSDARASMMLLIPGDHGRDMNDLDVVANGGEEWMRWGDETYRPMATVPILAPGATNPVSIGAEGYAEWRAIPAGTAPRTVTVTGTTGWRAYDASFQALGSGGATGRLTVPAGTGSWNLMLFGDPGARIGVTVE